ncbi:putative F-box/kelch-repeat protein [Cardamine amara subsp. amara]|uniref:F-box/kelch-repeat protein n=1 Tax=Cardamine amara subsp. amara TaxID=228776 RepID=A0ABD0ZST5_CARAN
MMKESLESSPTFSSLPYDIIFNCLARVSRFHYPTLSLVSKEFHSLLASRELYATRSRIGKTEDFLFVCLNLTKDKNPKPRWFTLSTIPKQQKLLPIPLFPHQHPKSSTVVSTGSVIYIIGGFVWGNRSKRVSIFDSRSHQWSRLPKMRLPRASAAAHVTDGKIYVIGGSKYNTSENKGEVYDPNTQTWEHILLTTPLDLTTQVSQKVYDMHGLKMKICFVEIDNLLYQTSVSNGKLKWRHPSGNVVGWTRVKGLEQELSPNHLTYVEKSGGGRRVTVWWKSMVIFRAQGHSVWSSKECKTEIWCAEISFERRGLEELWGFVEWSKNVFTFNGYDSPTDFVLDSAIVTY